MFQAQIGCLSGTEAPNWLRHVSLNKLAHRQARYNNIYRTCQKNLNTLSHQAVSKILTVTAYNKLTKFNKYELNKSYRDTQKYISVKTDLHL